MSTDDAVERPMSDLPPDAPQRRVFWVEGDFENEQALAQAAVQERCGRLVAVGDELLGFAEDLLTPPWRGRRPDGLRDALVLGIAARATKTYRAGLVLAKHGFGEPTAVLARTLWEDFLDIYWARMDPVAAANHYEDDYRRRLQGAAREILANSLGVSDDHLARAHALADEDLGPKVARIRVDERLALFTRYWQEVVGVSDEAVRALLDEVGYIKGVLNRFSSGHVHTSGQAMQSPMERKPGFLDAAPSTQHVPLGLQGIWWGYWQVVVLVATDFFRGGESLPLAELKKRGNAVFDEQADRSDPAIPEPAGLPEADWPRRAASTRGTPGVPASPGERSYVVDVLSTEVDVPAVAPWAESALGSRLWQGLHRLARRNHPSVDTANWARLAEDARAGNQEAALGWMRSGIARASMPYLARAELVYLDAGELAQVPDWGSDKAFLLAAEGSWTVEGPMAVAFGDAVRGPLAVQGPDEAGDLEVAVALIWRDELDRLNLVPFVEAPEGLVPLGRVVFGRSEQRGHDRSAGDVFVDVEAYRVLPTIDGPTGLAALSLRKAYLAAHPLVAAVEYLAALNVTREPISLPTRQVARQVARQGRRLPVVATVGPVGPPEHLAPDRAAWRHVPTSDLEENRGLRPCDEHGLCGRLLVLPAFDRDRPATVRPTTRLQYGWFAAEDPGIAR